MDRYSEEQRQDRRSALGELLQSYGWTEVALPALKRRLQDQQWALVMGELLDIDQIRYRQGYVRALWDLVENPAQFLDEVTR